LSDLIHRAFTRAYRASRWVRRRFTPLGLFLLVLFIASAVLGADTYSTLIYQIATLAGAALLVGLLGGRRFAPRIAAERSLPELATAGEPLRYRVRIRNEGLFPEKGLSVRESLDPALPTAAELRQAHEPGEEFRNWFDRKLGYPRWEWLIAQKQGADVRDRPLPIIPPGATGEVEMELIPRRRGHIRLPALSLWRTDPLGLTRAVREIPLAATLLVLPRRYPIPVPELPGQRHYQRGGLMPASTVGDAEEFHALRDYRPGDPLRRIHWRSWAKTGHPVVKEFQEEYFVRHALVLDTFATPAQAAAFEDAISVAASLVTRMPSRDVLLDLIFVGEGSHSVTADRGCQGDAQLLETLASLSPTHGRPFSALRALLSQRVGLLSGCVCVLLGWDSERQGLVGSLRGLGLAVEVYTLVDGGGLPAAGPMADEPRRFHPIRVGELGTRFPKP